jgi:ABC-type glycerol-3-phosphate transport system substrate-binding protein
MMRAVFFVLAAGLMAGACATTESAQGGDANADASNRGDRDKNACLKMCEVAGDAEGNADEVDRCKAACEG